MKATKEHEHYYDRGTATKASRPGYEIRARDQDHQILSYFRAAPPGTATSPSRIWQRFRQWPLTSIRRSLTNLTAAGHLEKLDDTVDGAYGRPEHLWRLIPGQQQLF